VFVDGRDANLILRPVLEWVECFQKPEMGRRRPAQEGKMPIQAIKNALYSDNGITDQSKVGHCIVMSLVFCARWKCALDSRPLYFRFLSDEVEWSNFVPNLLCQLLGVCGQSPDRYKRATSFLSALHLTSLTPDELGKLSLVTSLGAGSYGCVWEVHHPMHGRAALKICSKDTEHSSHEDHLAYKREVFMLQKFQVLMSQWVTFFFRF
jgi:hypothetical protein